MSLMQNIVAEDPSPAEIGADLEACAPVELEVDPRAEREARQLGMLRQMRDETMRIQTLLAEAAERAALRRLETVRDDVAQAAPETVLAGIGRAHANLVRVTRLLMLTEIQIEDARIDREAGIVRAVRAKAAKTQAEAESWQAFHDRCTQEHVLDVQDVMEEMIEGEVGVDQDRADQMLKAMYGALNRAAEVEGFTERCTGDVAADLCQTLGFTPDWKDWAHKDWAREEAELEMEGSPYCPPPRVVEDADGRYRFSSVRARGTGPP